MAWLSQSDLRPEDLARSALLWVARGGTWEALAREIAWQAAQAAGANYATIDWLAPLVAERLAVHVDGLEFQVDMASVRARATHRQRRPADHDGAETAATVEGYDEAIGRVCACYVAEVEWASALLRERLENGRRRERHSPLRVRRTRPADMPALPQLVRDGLKRASRRAA